MINDNSVQKFKRYGRYGFMSMDVGTIFEVRVRIK